MRLSERFENKVTEAISKLPVLDMERKQIDYEIVPVMVPAGKDLITTFVVALFMPCGPADYVSHMARPDDPYAPQQVVDNLVRDLYEKVRAEIDSNLKPGKPGLSKGGLVLPS